MIVKKWLMWIPLAVLIALCVCMVVMGMFLSDFRMPGTHVIGEYAHIKLQEKCFFIENGDDGPQVTGESVLTISAMVYPKKENGGASSITGHINVEEYPFSLEHGYNSTGARVYKTHILISNHSTVHLNTNWEIFYQVWITRSDPSIIFIEIFDSNEQVVVAVCADSQEEAIENYTKFLREMTNFEV